jgi:hypothetical protein
VESAKSSATLGGDAIERTVIENASFTRARRALSPSFRLGPVVEEEFRAYAVPGIVRER